MSKETLVIGIDGGGTKTLGAIADSEGKILAQEEVGSSNPHSNTLDVVRANLGTLINKLLLVASAEASQVSHICLGMAGVDRPEDKPMIRNLIHEFLPDTTVIPVNDGVIALVGGTLTPVGIIAISGTGSIAFGMNPEGERVRAGGWGHILGDEGSGYMIGLRGLRAVMRAHDGRTEPTLLYKIVLDHLKFDRPEQILGWVRDNGGSKSEIAALSRLVHQAAEEKDGIAQVILHEEAYELAATATAVADKLFGRDSQGWELVVAGGNLRKAEGFYHEFAKAFSVHYPQITVTRPRREPVEGAVLLALQEREKPTGFAV